MTKISSYSWSPFESESHLFRDRIIVIGFLIVLGVAQFTFYRKKRVGSSYIYSIKLNLCADMVPSPLNKINFFQFFFVMFVDSTTVYQFDYLILYVTLLAWDDFSSVWHTSRISFINNRAYCKWNCTKKNWNNFVKKHPNRLTNINSTITTLNTY